MTVLQQLGHPRGTGSGAAGSVRIRANRQRVDKRFPYLGFSVDTGGRPYFEVLLTSDPALFNPNNAGRRNAGNFYSSRQNSGLIKADQSDEPQVYMTPAVVLRNLGSRGALYYTAVAYADRKGSRPAFAQNPTSLAREAPSVAIASDMAGAAFSAIMGIPLAKLKRVEVEDNTDAMGFGNDDASAYAAYDDEDWDATSHADDDEAFIETEDSRGFGYADEDDFVETETGQGFDDDEDEEYTAYGYEDDDDDEEDSEAYGYGEDEPMPLQDEDEYLRGDRAMGSETGEPWDDGGQAGAYADLTDEDEDTDEAQGFAYDDGFGDDESDSETEAYADEDETDEYDAETYADDDDYEDETEAYAAEDDEDEDEDEDEAAAYSDENDTYNDEAEAYMDDEAEADDYGDEAEDYAYEDEAEAYMNDDYDDGYDDGEAEAYMDEDDAYSDSYSGTPLDIAAKKKLIRTTATFESAGKYGAINADGEFKGKFKNHPAEGVYHVGLSWGIVQFTQDGGSLGKVLKAMHAKDATAFQKIFGSNYKELLRVTNLKGIPSRKTSSGRSVRVQPIAGKDLWEQPWYDRFKKAGDHKPFQAVQNEMAAVIYLDPMLAWAKRMGLTTERALSIVFDRAVQMGTGGARKWILSAISPIKTTADRTKALKALGYNTLKELQKAYGLGQDNKWGSQTHSAMYDALGKLSGNPFKIPTRDQALAKMVKASATKGWGHRVKKLHDTTKLSDTEFTF